MSLLKRHIWESRCYNETYSNYDCKKLWKWWKNLGKLLSKELGVHCYDRELLRMASEQSGINEALFGEVDEKVKSLPLFGISKKIYKGEVFPPESDDLYLTIIFLTISQGN